MECRGAPWYKQHMKISANSSLLLISLLLCGCGLQAGFPEAFKEKNGVNTPAVIGKKIFLTESTFTGNFGGVAMADAQCAEDRQNPDTGIFRALVVDGTNRISTPGQAVDWVLKPSQIYTRLDGTVIGTTNASALFTLPLVSPISATPAPVWTGLSTGWAIGSHCERWKNPAATGNSGEASSTTATAFFGPAAACNLSLKIICVQQ